MTYRLIQGDCLDVLPTLPAQSIDAVITDPPYAEVDRDYGRLTEAAWWDLMMGVCAEARRVLKPTGSAVFILQPNSRQVGSVRGWLWEFMAWVCRDWNMVQDAYWWNYTALPVGGAPSMGLMRPSVKPCIWAGPKNCYRNQDAVLLTPSANSHTTNIAVSKKPSGRVTRNSHMLDVAAERGGSTPYNLLPIMPETNGFSSGSSAYGHGAGTPLKLADWWTRYITRPGGTVLDPFNGAGTMGVAAVQNGCDYIGIEKMPQYVEASHERLAATLAQPSLFVADTPAMPEPEQAAMFAAA